ncbi:MAG: hypothetical protein B6I36_09125, partial [Desulfobacteraceae bacterium 4572_35.1]
DCRLVCGMEVRVPDSGRVLELLAGAAECTADPGILYESREILVVDKPSGIAVHAGVGHTEDNLTARVEKLLHSRGLRCCCAPVHRLDVGTSGPVVFGKGRRALAELGRLFMRAEVEKRYLALVAGKTPGSGVIHSSLHAKGKLKTAATSFEARWRNDTASLLELCLFTGRQHQIRRHLAAMGHPVYGDRRYGGPCPPQLQRMFLHCHSLCFADPFSAAVVSIVSELPSSLADFAAVQQDDAVGKKDKF